MSQEGKVYLVGSGPGNPELMTIKAARLISGADVIVFDYLIASEVLGWAKEGAEKICVGKRSGFHSIEQSEIHSILVAKCREGKQVVRLKGGDPFVFGRGGEEASALRTAGVVFEVVPAVTAALGCAAYAGIPLTHRHASAAVSFISGHERPDKSTLELIDWKSHAQSGATLVLYMAMGRLAEIVSALVAGGRSPDEPVAVVQWGTTHKQRILRSRLNQLVEDVKEGGFEAPSVVIIGDTVAQGDDLRWFHPEEMMTSSSIPADLI